MFTTQLHFARPALSRLLALAACVAVIAAPLAGAQAPAASGSASAAQAPSPEELEKLVGPIALYPDDLVALILPASTNPLQMVQAERFLERRKKEPKLAVNDQWDDSVKSLVNYPEVVKKMSDDLDWTADLGEAVVANQGAVLDAVQGFRRKAQSAGNLKTDAKQQVVVEQEVIKIVPSDPQVVYVPQYNPTTVVAYSPTPAYGYYPYAYPSYYYPYAPGAALATGLIWGAAIGAVWGGNHYGTNWSGGNNNITINNNRNANVNRSQQRSQTTAWKSDKRPGQVSSGAGRSSTSRFAGNRPGDAGGARGTGQRGGDLGGGARGGTQRGAEGAGGARGSQLGDAGGGRGTQRGAEGAGGARGGTQRGAEGAGGARGSSQLGAQGAGGGRGASGGMQGSASRGQSGGGALGGYSSGNAARANSSRGASSRSSMSSHGGGMRGGGGRRGR